VAQTHATVTARQEQSRAEQSRAHCTTHARPGLTKLQQSLDDWLSTRYTSSAASSVERTGSVEAAVARRKRGSRERLETA